MRRELPSAAQDFAQIRNDQGWVVADLGFGVAADTVTETTKVKVALMVVLEGDAAAVGGPAVGLDCNPLGAPEEVDGPAADTDVDLGPRQTVAATEREEVPLEVAAGAVAPGATVERITGELRLADRAANELGFGASTAAIQLLSRFRPPCPTA